MHGWKNLLKPVKDSELITIILFVRRRERLHGQFTRRFQLPDTADIKQISAKAEDGVLTVTVPKKEPEKQPEFEDIAIE